MVDFRKLLHGSTHNKYVLLGQPDGPSDRLHSLQREQTTSVIMVLALTVLVGLVLTRYCLQPDGDL